MTYPVDIPLGGGRLSLHLVMELLAFGLGFQYYSYLRRRQRDLIPDANRMSIIIGAIFGALIGSRLIGALENPAAWADVSIHWCMFS